MSPAGASGAELVTSNLHSTTGAPHTYPAPQAPWAQVGAGEEPRVPWAAPCPRTEGGCQHPAHKEGSCGRSRLDPPAPALPVPGLAVPDFAHGEGVGP